jgi:hypothetical protein
MSYKLGAEAFLNRFLKRFPQSSFQWKAKIGEELILIPSNKVLDFLYDVKKSDEYQELSPLAHQMLLDGLASGRTEAPVYLGSFSKYYEEEPKIFFIFQHDKKIAEIDISLEFGIKLSISSDYLKGKHFVLHRRPLNIVHATQNHRRHWLANKPKFGKLGVCLASEIYHGLNKN